MMRTLKTTDLLIAALLSASEKNCLDLTILKGCDLEDDEGRRLTWAEWLRANDPQFRLAVGVCADEIPEGNAIDWLIELADLCGEHQLADVLEDKEEV